MSATTVSTTDPVLARKRKMLLVLPLLVIPFLAMFFWAFGGGKGKKEVVAQRGINTAIPSTTNTQILGKDEAYRRAMADSELRAKQAADQNYVYGGAGGPVAAGPAADPYAQALAIPAGNTPVQAALGSGSNDINSKVDASLNDLRRQANSPSSIPETGAGDYLSEQQKFTQNMLSNDPVYQMLMKQSLGDKKLDTTNARAVTDKEAYTPVETANERYNPVSRLYNAGDSNKRQSRFYSGTAGGSARRAGVNTIGGVVHQDQTVKEGTIVKIRLTNDINLAGLLIPKNTFVYAMANLGQERLNMTVTSIAYGSSIYPVKLIVFDVDGLPGIRVPGSMDRDARAAAASQVINGNGSSLTGTGAGGVTVNSNPNFGSQVASQVTGSIIESGKQLLTRKVAQQKVFLKANYKIYLKQASSI